MADHERIWLQNPADADPEEGRMWCQDKVWPDSSGEGEPTEYIRADLAAAPDMAEALEGAIVEMKEAMRLLHGEALADMQTAYAAARAALKKAKGEA